MCHSCDSFFGSNLTFSIQTRRQKKIVNFVKTTTSQPSQLQHQHAITAAAAYKREITMNENVDESTVLLHPLPLGRLRHDSTQYVSQTVTRTKAH